MIPKKKDPSKRFLIFFLVFSCLSFSAAEYCKNNTDIPFDDKPVNSDEWDACFKALFSNLSSYEVQSDRSKYNVENIAEWGKKGKSEGLFINEENVKQFFDKVKSSFNISRPSYLDNKTLSKVQFEKLNNVLEVTLRSKTSIECSKEYILITGHFISLKDVKNIYNIHRNADLLCEQEAVEEKRGIKIFALNKLFIDVEIDQYLFPSLTKKLPLVFIAPDWEIIGNVKINLDGPGGGEYQLPPKKPNSNIQKIQHLRFAKNLDRKSGEISFTEALGNLIINHQYDGHNKNGIAGIPGKPGGTFIGMGSKFINGKNLTISTQGGAGTAGTNGEAGRVVNKYTIKTINDCGNCVDTTTQECFQVIEDEILNFLMTGGNGGKRGIGGSSGNLTLIEVDSENLSGIVKVTGPGRDGQRGMGGPPGMIVNNLKPQFGKCYLDSNLQKFDYLKDDSEFGKTGLHDHVELEYEIPPFDNYELSEKKILKEYQDYFRNNFDVSMKDFTNLEFIDMMNLYAVSKNLITSDDLYHELDELETKYFEATNKNNLPPFYELLLNKIYAYVKNLKNFENYSEKKLLKYLYTVTLSKKNFLKENVKQEFIVDVTKFLKNLQDEFHKNDLKYIKTKILENMRNRVGKYKKRIERESEQAKNLTTKEIKNDLTELSKEIETSMQKLQKEIEEEKKKTREDGKDLEKAQSKLLTDLITKSAFSVVKALNAGLAIAGPKGAAASALLAPGLDLAETFATKGAEDRKKKVAALGTEIGKAVKEVDTQMKTLKELKEKAEEKKKRCLLKEVVKESKISSEIEGLSWKSLTEEDIDRLTGEEIEKKLQEGKEQLNSSKTGKFSKLMDFVKKNEKVITQTADSVVNIISAVQEYSSESDRIEKLIGKNKDIFKKLESFEKEVYPVLIQELQDMSEQFKSLGDNVGKKTKVDFDVSRKNMQFVLEKTKTQLLYSIGKYESSVNLILAIEKLEKILPYLYTANSVMKDYLEQENLADLLHDLNAETGDDETDQKINKLDVKAYSNVLLKKYKIAYQALEQFVFPFGNRFLDGLEAPEKLNISDNITSAVESVEKKLIEINERLTDFQSKITNFDQMHVKDLFQSRRNSTVQFYTWKNSDHKDVISKLLAGKEVYLNADIMKSPFKRRYAIKFDEIDLYFNIKNATEQKKLNELLTFFKVEQTHLGDNHYILKNKMYTLKTASLSLYYSFDFIDAELRRRVTSTDAIQKLKKGDLVLSPYATWKIKLYDEEQKDISYSDLAQFADKVDIELGGFGSYVKREKSDELNHDYKSMQTCDLIEEKSDEHSRRKREADSSWTNFYSFFL